MYTLTTLLKTKYFGNISMLYIIYTVASYFKDSKLHIMAFDADLRCKKQLHYKL